MSWALRAACHAETPVLAPAFTCQAVHEAVARSGRRLQLVDSSEDSFLMNPDALKQTNREPSAIVLCEVFGHTYDLTPASLASPVLRIIDMAMSVPEPSQIGGRLAGSDVAVISFGEGKSMYAGFGAMAFTQDADLAKELRRQREEALIRSEPALFLRRLATVSARALALHPFIYSMLAGLKKPSLHESSKGPLTPIPTEWNDQRPRGAEWVQPSTHLDRNLAMWNLDHTAAMREQRRTLARRYHELLAAQPGIVRPPLSADTLSHYTIRVAPQFRADVRRALHDAGIGTLTLWVSAPYVDERLFPNATQRSREVLNLPLHPRMSVESVERICHVLADAL